jgi:hypothetical protein
LEAWLHIAQAIKRPDYLAVYFQVFS